MPRWILTLAVTAAALLAPTAAAAASPADDPAIMGRAQAVATAYWGPNSCTGRIVVTITTEAAISALQGVNATPARGLTLMPSCAIYIARDRVSGPVGLCNLMVHEYGHAAGMHHVYGQPSSPMNGGSRYAVRACLLAFVPKRVTELRHRRFRCHESTQYSDWTCTRAHREPREIEMY